MTDEQREEARKELMEVRHKNADAASMIDAGVPDPGDMSINDYLSDFMHLLSDSKREQIMMIDEALLRMNEGTYGICQRCGMEILPERLKVQPFTPHCRDCQEEVEREEAIRTGRPELGKI